LCFTFLAWFSKQCAKIKNTASTFPKSSNKKYLAMANTNYPSTGTTSANTPNNNTRNIIIGVLAAGLLGTWGYFLLDNNKKKEEIQVKSAEVETVSDARDSVQTAYNDALTRLDSLVGSNNSLTGQLTERQTDIVKLKNQINAIVRNKNASAADLAKARTLISSLNDKINGLEAEVARLMGENQQLAANNTVLTGERSRLTTELQTTTQQKEELSQKVDVGSTFAVSNLNIKGIDEKGNGKEKETDKAKKVNKLVVSFDIANRIAQSGPADLYVVVTGPDGQVISNPSLGSGMLATRDDGERGFTAKKSIEYEQGTNQTISVPLRQDKFQTGDYKIEVYHNGFKIAEGLRSLRKSGFLGL
jgi:predicted nuclease with TOPRIM domain